MRRLDEHTFVATLLAFALAAAGVVGIALAYGWSDFVSAWSRTHPEWLIVAGGAELLTIPAYVFAYRAVAGLQGGPKLRFPLATRVVSAGFGPFAASGGFALDKRVLNALCEDERFATVRVLGLGALEWAILAPAACVCAVVLLAQDSHQVMRSVLWPWAIAVPVGFAIGLFLATPSRRKRIRSGRGGWRKPLGTVLAGVGVLHELLRRPVDNAGAWLGVSLYWLFDMAAFWGAVRFAGLQPGLAATIIAYATGYALTRRSSPFGGAGVTEVLMTFALHWAGQPVIPALVAVVVYRVFNFVVPTLPALLTHQRVKPILEAAAAG